MKVVKAKREKGKPKGLPSRSFFKGEDLSVSEIMPYKRISDKGYVVDRNDAYQGILKVKTSDLQSITLDDLERHIGRYTDLHRVYVEPFQKISMSSPTQTKAQQIFWKQKVASYQMALAEPGLLVSERNKLTTRLRLAGEAYRRVVAVEKVLPELAFYFVIYGQTEREIESNMSDMIRLGGRELGLQHVSDQAEIEKILFQLLNMNTEV